MGEIQKIEKSKVAVVNPNGEILVLTRSIHEDTRQGESDWPGGTIEEGETPVIGLNRDSEEELPGTRLQNIRPLHIASKIVGRDFVVSYLFAATAEFPNDGIELSHEHSAFAWVPQDRFPDLDIPKKYKTAVALGAPILHELAELSAQVPTNIQSNADMSYQAAA